MANKRSARTHGSLSDRQWKDLRQAARLARSENVTLTWRRDGSILISPYNPPVTATGIRQRQEARAPPDSQLEDAQPMDTVSESVVRPRQRSKKQLERDAKRAMDNRALVASPWLARFELLTSRLLWAARKASCNAVWTAWMRHRQAVHKLRSLFWREWTRPHIAPPAHIGPPGSRLRAKCQGLLVLGLRSCRDEYILRRARASALHCSGGSREISGWLRQHAGTADPMMSPGVGTPAPKARSRMTRGGRGGRGGMSP